MSKAEGGSKGLQRYMKRQQRRLSGKMLGIGDGANDVAMIQAADVGIGIMGKEGRQVLHLVSLVPAVPTAVHWAQIVFQMSTTFQASSAALCFMVNIQCFSVPVKHLSKRAVF